MLSNPCPKEEPLRSTPGIVPAYLCARLPKRGQVLICRQGVSQKDRDSSLLRLRIQGKVSHLRTWRRSLDPFILRKKEAWGSASPCAAGLLKIMEERYGQPAKRAKAPALWLRFPLIAVYEQKNNSRY